jgi:hypothetical protein
LLCLPVAAISGTADKGKTAYKQVSGKITDTFGEVLSGSKITVKETGETVFANFEGVFKLSLEAGKAYSITIETIGYAPKEVKSSELSLFSEFSLSPLQ